MGEFERTRDRVARLEGLELAERTRGMSEGAKHERERGDGESDKNRKMTMIMTKGGGKEGPGDGDDDDVCGLDL